MLASVCAQTRSTSRQAHLLSAAIALLLCAQLDVKVAAGCDSPGVDTSKGAAAAGSRGRGRGRGRGALGEDKLLPLGIKRLKSTFTAAVNSCKEQFKFLDYGNEEAALRAATTWLEEANLPYASAGGRGGVDFKQKLIGEVCCRRGQLSNLCTLARVTCGRAWSYEIICVRV